MSVAIVNSDCSIEFSDNFDLMAGESIQAIIAQSNEIRRKLQMIKTDHEISDIVIEHIKGNAKFPAPGYLVGLCVQICAQIFGLDHQNITLGPISYRWDYLGILPNVKADNNYADLRKRLADKLVQVTLAESMLDRHDLGLNDTRQREAIFQAFYHMIQTIPGFRVKAIPNDSDAQKSQHK